MLSDGVPFHNRFGTPSEDIHLKRKVVEVISVKASGGLKGEYLLKEVPSGKPLPSGSKVRGIFWLKPVQKSSPESKVIAASMDKRVGNPRTQRKLILCSKVNERIKGSQHCTV